MRSNRKKPVEDALNSPSPRSATRLNTAERRLAISALEMVRELVAAFAYETRASVADREELLSIAREAQTIAALDYDASRGTTFSTFVRMRIGWALRIARRKQRKARIFFGADDSVADESNDGALASGDAQDDLLHDARMRRALAEEIARAPALWRHLWQAHYIDEIPLRAIAKRLGLPLSTLCRHHQKLLGSLRRALEGGEKNRHLE